MTDVHLLYLVKDE
jgi:hypothetical protein